MTASDNTGISFDIQAIIFFFIKAFFRQIMASIDQNKIMQVLDWAYEKAVSGSIGLGTAQELAMDYMKDTKTTPTEQANSLIRWQITKAGTSGFLTGLGGIITMPVTVPVNLTSVLYVQIRMIAAIAHIGGHDVKDDRVKALVYACLVGNSAKDVLKDVGIVFGKKMAEQAIKNISRETIVKINKAVGFKLLTKFGEKGLINLGKTLPFLGGVISACFDSVATKSIGNIARKTFIEHDKQLAFS